MADLTSVASDVKASTNTPPVCVMNPRGTFIRNDSMSKLQSIPAERAAK